MRDINSVVLTARLTKDADIKYTKSGTAVLAMSIAVNRSVKDGEGWKDEASFFDLSYFGKGAEAVAPYCLKGTPVVISGELQQDRWEQDGQKREKVRIIVKELRLAGSKPQAEHVQQVADTFEDDRDIPF